MEKITLIQRALWIKLMNISNQSGKNIMDEYIVKIFKI
jgi:hypothetical protein